MKKLSLGISVIVLSAAVCFAGTQTVPLKMKAGKDKMVTPVEELYRANEFDISAFAAFATGRVDQHKLGGDRDNPGDNRFDSSAWGGGIEADYFYTRYFGVGLEGDWLAGSGVISAVSGSLIGRLPFENGSWGWAPYAFVGGGGQFDGEAAGFGHVGAGIDFRLQCHWGAFSDARWVLHDRGIDYALIRAGIRYNF